MLYKGSGLKRQSSTFQRQGSDLTGINSLRREVAVALRKDARYPLRRDSELRGTFYQSPSFIVSPRRIFLKTFSERETSGFGVISLHGFSALSSRLQWTLPSGSRLLPPVTRRARQLSFMFHGAVFDGFINSTSFSVGYITAAHRLLWKRILRKDKNSK